MSERATTLNPGASEFVPNFSVPDMSNLNINDNQTATLAEEQTYQPPANNQRYQNQNNYHQQQTGYYQNQHHHNNHHNSHHHQQQQQQQPPQQQFYGQNYNNSHRHSYNPNYRGRNRNYNHHHHNNHYGNNNGYHGYNQHQHQQQSYDVDSFELEARCDAVIEILQDDKIRDQLNPVSNYASETEAEQKINQQGAYSEINNNADPQLDDEEEMAEMMAMQEECRLEMMKFYIQSQNPTLFEEIYHDVSYPEAAGSKKVPEEELRSPKVMSSYTSQDNAEESSITDTPNNTLRDLIINELNPDVAEFVPYKFSSEAEVNTNESTETA